MQHNHNNGDPVLVDMSWMIEYFKDPYLAGEKATVLELTKKVGDKECSRHENKREQSCIWLGVLWYKHA